MNNLIKRLKSAAIPLFVLATALLSGCSAFLGVDNRERVGSSLSQFLYGDEATQQVVNRGRPHLDLPLRVGIAFVPGNQSHWANSEIPQAQQTIMLNQVKAAFAEKDYIDSIEVIPSTYLKHSQGQGFETMEQLGNLYNLDVMALVSYDQLKQTNENKAALLYWTIVGMYLVPGNENAVQTFVDTAVFDIKTRTLLFRAPGVSRLTDRSTAVNVQETLDNKATEGFDIAINDMITNLDAASEAFKERIKDDKSVTVTNRGGAGSTSIAFLLLAGVGCWVRRVQR